MNSSRLKYLQELLSENPNDPFVHYGIAIEYMENEPARCSELLKNTAEKFPDYLPVYFTLGNLLYENEDYASALTLVKIGIDLAKTQNNPKAQKELEQLKLNIEFEI
ncbi:MAG: tetratricopeptide repeat protein [Cyclobacteriaceae bacterium]|nr:tetratricopeptide repeat protein [Cyclobacteriaceae bacterium]